METDTRGNIGPKTNTPKFQQRHYVAIAEVVNGLRSSDNTDNLTMGMLQHRLCEMFIADNPAFDRDRFQAACKPESEGVTEGPGER